jgi:hypothetical protein
MKNVWCTTGIEKEREIGCCITSGVYARRLKKDEKGVVYHEN